MRPSSICAHNCLTGLIFAEPRGPSNCIYSWTTTVTFPVFAHITEAATADITVARRLKFAAGTVVVFDRGYNDYNWYADLTRQGVFFVTRLKDRADYEVLEDRPLPKNRRVVRDQVIFLSRTGRPGQNLFLGAWSKSKIRSLAASFF